MTKWVATRRVTRIVCFDLGVVGALVEADIGQGGCHIKRHQMWNLGKQKRGLDLPDEQRYPWFMEHIGTPLSRADAVLYELVQFNRGFSTIPGFRAILLAVAQSIYKLPVFGVNVATLKSFAGLKKVPKGESKKYMSDALSAQYPQHFMRVANGNPQVDDNLIDAVWLAIWASKNVEVERG